MQDFVAPDGNVGSAHIHPDFRCDPRAQRIGHSAKIEADRVSYILHIVYKLSESHTMAADDSLLKKEIGSFLLCKWNDSRLHGGGGDTIYAV